MLFLPPTNFLSPLIKFACSVHVVADISCIYRAHIVHISCTYRACIVHTSCTHCPPDHKFLFLIFFGPASLPNSCFGSQTIPSGHFFVCLNYAGSSTSLPSANFPLTRASHLSRVPACIGFVSQSAKCWHGQVSCVPPSFDCPMNDPP